MKALPGIAASFTLLLALAVVGPARGQDRSRVTLETAIGFRTQCLRTREDALKELNLGDAQAVEKLLAEQALSGRELGPDAPRGIEKLFFRAEEKRRTGEAYFSKDDFARAAESYNAATKLYSWLNKEFLEKLKRAAGRLERGRVLSQHSAKPDDFEKADREARGREINAEGFMLAGEPERALGELERGTATLDKLAGPVAAATLEQAVEARQRMIAVRSRIKTSETTAEGAGKAQKEPVFADGVRRGRGLEKTGEDALKSKDYPGARALFAAAQKYYQEAVGVEDQRQGALIASKNAEAARKAAAATFKTGTPPASFVQAQATAKEAEEALGKMDFDKAKELFARAAEGYKAAQAEVGKVSRAETARAEWSKLLSEANTAMLQRYVAAGFAQVKAQAESASPLVLTESEKAAEQFAAATAKLKDLITEGQTKENQMKAAPLIARFDVAVAAKDKFAAANSLAELEKLIPNDTRLVAMRTAVETVPTPSKQFSVDLGSGVTMEFVLIEPGSFTMGSEKGDGDEKPTHKVTISKPFYQGKCEVTQEQWQIVMSRNPSTHKAAKNPVENVSWNDCRAFIEKLREKCPGREFSLPTEAQWEYACRAGSATAYCYGDDDARLGDYAWFGGNSSNDTHPVGEKKPNAWGLHDTHGNIWEWCADWYGPYAAGETTDPTGAASGQYRVLRGGSFSGEPASLRAACRRHAAPEDAHPYFGLRVACAAGR